MSPRFNIMRTVFFALLLLLSGCELAEQRRPVPSQSDQFADWYVVACPECNREGWFYVDAEHPLHEYGYDIGWHVCNSCQGDGVMLTNGHGVYTHVRDLKP